MISILNKLKKHLKSDRGSVYVETGIAIYVLVFLLALIISVMPIFTHKQELDTIAMNIARNAEQIGSTSDVSSETSRLSSLHGIDISVVSVTPNGRVEHGESFTIVLSSSCEVGVGNLKVTIPLTKTVSGRGEHYWK